MGIRAYEYGGAGWSFGDGLLPSNPVWGKEQSFVLRGQSNRTQTDGSTSNSLSIGNIDFEDLL